MPRNKSVLILSAAEVRQALPMRQAIEAMKEAFAALSSGRALVPPRTHLAISRNSGLALIMPAYVDDADQERQALAIKVVSLFDGNQRKGLPRINAAVLVIEPATGRALALLEGATLTALRTAAASGLATDLLARRESKTLAIFGAGVQARAHLEAVCAVRPIENVWIYGRTPGKVETLIEEVSRSAGVTARLHAASSSREALANGDIVCATTTSSEPVFNDTDLQPGTHINAVGSFTPLAREVPAETVVRARVVVDSRHAAWEEAGDLIGPLTAGLIEQDHIRAELGELVLGRAEGRTHPGEVTLFKSVGVAVQDALAARFALAGAQRQGLGTQVAW